MVLISEPAAPLLPCAYASLPRKEKIIEESAASKKTGRKRGRPRKGGGRGTGSGLTPVSVLGSESGSISGSGSGSGTNRGRGRGAEGSRGEEDDSDRKGLTPPEKDVDNAVDLVETVVEPSDLTSPPPNESKEGIDSGGSGSGGDDGSPSGCDKMEIDTEPDEARQMAQGEAKVRALAKIRAYCASQPPGEYGRDEGWISPEEEARETREREGDTGEGSEAIISSESSKGASDVPREAPIEDVETRGTDDAGVVAPTSSSEPAAAVAAAAAATGVQDGAIKRGRADGEKVQGEGQPRGKKQRKPKITPSHEAERAENSSSNNGNIGKKRRLQEVSTPLDFCHYIFRCRHIEVNNV